METQDLTKGNITKQLFQMVAPLVLGNILQQMYNMVDALIISRYASAEEFAAIGVAATITNLFLFIIIGACSGVSILFAQLYGQKNYSEMRQEHFLVLVMGIVGTAIIAACGFVGTRYILCLMHTPTEILSHSETYLKIILMGLLFSFLYNLYSSLLRAVGNTKTSLLILCIATILNIVLDFVLVGAFKQGITGAAAATVIAQGVSAMFCIGFLILKVPKIRFEKKDCTIKTDMLKKTLHYTVTTAVHQSGLYIGKLLVQGAVNTGGVSMIMAYTATTRLEGFANSFGDSGCAATSIITAQNYGAGEKKRVEETYRKSRIILLVFGAACSVILFFLANVGAGIMLNAWGGEAFEGAVSYLKLIAVFYVFCFTGNTFAGYFDGIGKVTIPMLGAVGHISIRVILSWIMIKDYGLNAVALATGLGWIIANLFWEFMYLRGRNRK